MRRLCFVDIETDALIQGKNYPNISYVGVMDYATDEYKLFDRTKLDECKDYLDKFQMIATYNGDTFDMPILFKHDILPMGFKRWDHIDLLKVCKDKGKLNVLGYSPENYKLRTIAQTLGFKTLKGDIDYNIFKKDKWTKKEVKEIEKYLLADLKVTKDLFLFLEESFKPLMELMPENKVQRFSHITSSASSIAYQSICNVCNIKPEYNDSEDRPRETFEGGLHIEPRNNLVQGKIISYDFASAYPHAIISNNLLSREGKRKGKSKGYYDLQGNYEQNVQGKMEVALRDILIKRLKAKQEGNKKLNNSLKLIINSFYGTLGNSLFKKTYDPIAAADCTRVVRTWLRKVSARLEGSGCQVIYGFTDSVYVSIPNHLQEDFVQRIIDDEISLAMDNASFNTPTFKMEKEGEFKLFFIVTLNNYLLVKQNGDVKLKGAFKGLNDRNTSEIVKLTWEKFCVPTIQKELRVNFDQEEIKAFMINKIEENPDMCAKKYSVKEASRYKSPTQLQAKISTRYGEGIHMLIPNTKGVGVPTGAKRKGVQRGLCTIKEFHSHNLKASDIEIKKFLDCFKPFKVEK